MADTVNVNDVSLCAIKAVEPTLLNCTDSRRHIARHEGKPLLYEV
jgi:hypothetical protein